MRRETTGVVAKSEWAGWASVVLASTMSQKTLGGKRQRITSQGFVASTLPRESKLELVVVESSTVKITVTCPVRGGREKKKALLPPRKKSVEESR
jgi:hypothetical protein